LQPSELLITNPAILSNPLAFYAKAYIRRIFRKELAFVYVNVPREAMKNKYSSLWFNVESAKITLYLVIIVLKYALSKLYRRNIGIIVLYIA
jgi:hypothetical protein